MIAVIGAGLLLFKMLTGRLHRLDNAITLFTQGKQINDIELPPRKVRFTDEIDHFETTFLQMASRIERQVDELQKMDATRREFVANISHDLRTPLAALKGYIETMAIKNGKLTDTERKKYLAVAASHCDRLGKLVNDLFELSRLESDKISIDNEPFHLGELVQDVTQEFQLKVKEKQINLLTNVGRDLPLTCGDIGMVERVFVNMLDNAIHHTPEGGSISLLLFSGDDRITVQVSDTGSGIPEKEQENIFERFYQVDKSRGDKKGHSGLGLAIAKRIIELHEGDLTVESEVNSGTTFSFTLPIYKS